MSLEDAIQKVERWVGPLPDGNVPDKPDFQMRCAIRRVIRGAKEGREHLNRIQIATEQAIEKVGAE